MKLTVPELCLVVLIGPTGAGKSTFARKLFHPMEVLSSDFCRGLVSNDENCQDATGDAFDTLKFIAAKRLARGLLTVIDATNVQEESRKPLVALAREHDVLPVAIVLNLPEKLCHDRNRQRPDRNFGSHVIRQHLQQLRRSLRGLEREGFRYVHVLNSPDEVEQAELERKPLWNNRKWDAGPFDIIGDVHGCFDELHELLTTLGYTITRTTDPAGAERSGAPRSAAPGRPDTFTVTPPDSRKAVFLGDLVDRGPNSPDVLHLVMSMVNQGCALAIPGNHDIKFLRKLRGRDVQIAHGLAQTLEQMSREPQRFHSQVEQFIDTLVGHYVLDGGKLVVAHAGLKEQYIGRASGRVREFALYGETTGETDEFGLPVRHNWAAEYRGNATIIYGHTPVPQADWLNRTLNIDTGCVFGGKLTALRWPERDIVSVAAKRTYAQSSKPFLPDSAVPIFGAPPTNAKPIDRPGAYAIIRNDAGLIAVMKVGDGWFLPGGGADADESPHQNLAREILEECGRHIDIGREIGQAVQHVTTRSGTFYAKQCTYFAATFLDEDATAPTEPDHELHWLTADVTLQKLVLEADAWALRRVLQSPASSQLSAQQQHDDVLDIDDVLGKRIIATRLHHSVTVREENAAAALEVMSRFATNPKWLIYLPPTMSPPETTDHPGLLEHPDQAFDYFRSAGVDKVICEEKHMGSRAVVIVARDTETVARRFGIQNDSSGIIYTRTGRRFFEDRQTESELLAHLRTALTNANFWDDFQSDWFCLDCELMPWSAKAQDLLKNQYAAVGAAARTSTAQVLATLEQAHARYSAAGIDDLAPILNRAKDRVDRVNRYVDSYRRYCWQVNSVDDLKLAPFHLLAGEGKVHVDKDHAWHMQTLAKLSSADKPSPLMATAHRVVDLNDPADVTAGVAWWQSLTNGGGEGMVVKPLEFVVRGKRGLVQPAVKCRGPEYLRIIYGPEYDAPENLTRLRSRSVSMKRSLALREFALGIEALERFVRREPLRRVHECVFGVLALESAPVDPRL